MMTETVRGWVRTKSGIVTKTVEHWGVVQDQRVLLGRTTVEGEPASETEYREFIAEHQKRLRTAAARLGKEHEASK